MNMLPASLNYRNYNYDPSYSYHYERDDHFLTDLERQQQRNRRYQAALEEQAYLEALEKKRQKRLVEEEYNRRCQQQQYRQYLLELEQQRRKMQQQQEEKKRQQQYYLSYLDKRQQEKLRQERMRKKKIATLEDWKQKQKLKRRLNDQNNLTNQINLMNLMMNGFYHDQNPYKNHQFVSTDDFMHTDHNERKSDEVDVTTNQSNGQTSTFYVKPRYRKTEPSSTKMHHSDNRSVKLSEQLSKFEDGLKTVVNSKDIKDGSKKKKFIPRKCIQSSVLVGDVEDASDSECEDEYSDYMHTRRPQAGQWIEPIGAFLNSS